MFGLIDGVAGIRMILFRYVMIGMEQCCWSLSESWSYGVVCEALTCPVWILNDE